MLRNNLYYRLKPFIPRAVRIGFRRWLVKRKMKRVRDIWPILRGSERPPKGWPGWPDGKKFALVLTHDVEGPDGLAKCRQLMQLEMEMGFRSAFNFVPEGSYKVPKELRDELIANGFEVGVHDLHHDGKLYATRKGFSKQAKQINHYLKEWGAGGFRAGFMFHNLEWLHELELGHDSSTFDTDPFEPHPDSINTIFPFWVPARPSQTNANRAGEDTRSVPDAAGNGYVELPYTLPQDSTLFLILKEQTSAIWMRKLDWIARHGGMALVNVHPDYICFNGNAKQGCNYPVARYRQFLQHLRQKRGSAFWHALPREVAEFIKSLSPRPTLPRTRRICMITHSVYDCDNRVTRYAETLANRGDTVEVFALRNNAKMPKKEVTRGVKVFAIQDRFDKTEKAKSSFLLPLLRFLLIASWRVMQRHRAHRYDLLHVHNMPDFMVFAAWYPKLTGTKVILDIHDLLPEYFASKFNTSTRSSFVTGLKMVEKVSAAFADHVIIANDLFQKTYTSRSAPSQKCSVFLNNVDTSIFCPGQRNGANGKQIVLFPGSLEWHQGVDIAIRAVNKVRQKLPKVEFHIYGDGTMKPDLIALASELGMNGSVRFFKPLGLREIAEIMAAADLGVVPKRSDGFGNEAYSTKIMEFMAAGVPVVVSDTKVDRFYFNDSVVRFFESGNAEAMADAMLAVLGNPELRQGMVVSATDYVAHNDWERRKEDYLRLVDTLCPE